MQNNQKIKRLTGQSYNWRGIANTVKKMPFSQFKWRKIYSLGKKVRKKMYFQKS